LRHSATWDRAPSTELIFVHIGAALAVVVALGAATVIVLRRHNGQSFLTRPAALALTLLFVQLFLGVAAYITRLRSPNDPQPLNPMIGITVAHVACGALVFATTIVLTLRVFKVLHGPVHEFELVPRAQTRSLDSFQTPAGMPR